MIKVQIKKQNIITNEAQFETQSAAELWVQKESLNDSFGKLERWLKEIDFKGESIKQAIETRQIEYFNETMTEYKFPQEFEVIYIDRTIELLKSQREFNLNEIRKLRDAKLLRVDQLVNIAVLDAWTAAEKAELKSYRQALLDMTEMYKADMSLLDSLNLETIQLPVEPSAI